MRLTLRIHEGRCDPLGKQVYEAKLGRGESPPVTERLKDGPHALVAFATESDGTELARGCAEASLPQAGSVSVRLASSGKCRSADAAAPDAGSSDAESMPDVASQGDASPCPEDRLLCDGTCINVRANNDSCGDCTTVCPTGTNCVDGACQCNDGTRHCPNAGDGSSACIDTTTNNDFCGDCDTQCDVLGGQTCRDGTCSCDRDGLYCPNAKGGAGACVDALTDEQFCGDCDVVCPADAECTMGVCVCDGAGLTPCGDTCVDATNDDEHCGTCGNACVGGRSCSASECACPSTASSVCADTCVDLQTDENNCGRCDHSCHLGSTCEDGICRPDDAPSSCMSWRHGEHDYLFCTQMLSWTAARSACQGFGAGWDLAIVDDTDENTAIEEGAQAADPDQGWWLGGWDGAPACSGNPPCNCRATAAGIGSGTDVEGDWYWIQPGDSSETAATKTGRLFCRKPSDGEPCAPQDSSFVDWRPSRPDNVDSCGGCGCNGSDEDCLMVVPESGWEDNPCNLSKRFVCESF